MVFTSVGPWVLRSVCPWVLVIISGIACTKTEPPPPGAIVVGMTNSALDLDPRVATDEASQKAHQLLYSTLARIDENLRVVPELAESIVYRSGS